MRDDPLFLVFDIRCSSGEDASKVQELVRQICIIDSHILITVVSSEGSKDTLFEIADYFKDVLIFAGVHSNPRDSRIVFLRQPNADRFWKDMMVRVFLSLENAVPNARVALVYKGNGCLDWEFLRPA